MRVCKCLHVETTPGTASSGERHRKDQGLEAELRPIPSGNKTDMFGSEGDRPLEQTAKGSGGFPVS